ncbi:MAG: Hpt domain-containing protein [Alphaproteobacteria bacterium]|nr:Hpt domain-containing protein [Alphaproteobacteria bacterium SS10]
MPEQVRPRKVQRQLKRKLGADNAEDLISDLAQQIAAGKPVADHPATPLLGNFSNFVSDVVETYSHHDETVKLHIRNANISSDELNEANEKLAYLNHSLSTIMESLGEGLLFFDNLGICSDVYSATCVSMFGQSPAHRHICEVLGLDDSERSTVENLLDVVFTDTTAMSFDDLMDLMPSEYSEQGRNVTLSYRPVRDSQDAMRAIVMVAIDRTDELNAMEKIIEKEQEASKIIRISQNRNSFIRLVNNLRILFDRLDAVLVDDVTANEFKRDIHTFKGLAGSFYLTQLSDFLHDLETRLRGKSHDEIASICQSSQPKLLSHLDHIASAAGDWLGANFEKLGSIRTIPTERLVGFETKLMEAIEQGISATDIHQLYLEQISSVHILESLAVFELQMQELADRIGKQLQPLVFEGENISLVPEVYQEVIDALVHVGRNIVDHGIEPPDLRRELNKSDGGQVVVSVNQTTQDAANWIKIEIKDDGAGINIDALRQRLVEKAIISADENVDDHALIQHVFHDEVSTTHTVTQTSGRGVGMSAIRGAVEDLGGTVEMFSTKEQGCTLVINMPYIWAKT